jgi:hypothetical protein
VGARRRAVQLRLRRGAALRRDRVPGVRSHHPVRPGRCGHGGQHPAALPRAQPGAGRAGGRQERGARGVPGARVQDARDRHGTMRGAVGSPAGGASTGPRRRWSETSGGTWVRDQAWNQRRTRESRWPGRSRSRTGSSPGEPGRPEEHHGRRRGLSRSRTGSSPGEPAWPTGQRTAHRAGPSRQARTGARWFRFVIGLPHEADFSFSTA